MFKGKCVRPQLGKIPFILLCSLFISLCLNIAFYRQVMLLMPIHSLHDVFVFISMPIVAFSVINIVLTLASFFWLDRLLILSFILMSAAAQYFIFSFGVVIDRTMITNIIDTTSAESFALMTPKLIITLLLSAALPLVIIFWVRCTSNATWLSMLISRLSSIALSIIAILLIALFFYKDYASLFRNNNTLIKSLSPSNSISALYSYYKHHKTDNLPLIKIGEDAYLDAAVKKNPRKNLTILIVGETSRAKNFSLGGYSQQTNPRLEKDNVVYFPKTTSCGTATIISVPCMFSDMPREHFDDQVARHQEGLLDVIQRAGVKVLWNENDGGCKGVCDRVPHQDMTSLNLSGQCINGECLDEVLFHGLDDYINKLDDNAVIVLHTIGSHGPTYYRRYPPQFQKFTPTCDTNEIQNCSQEQLVNTYDNTILYVDYIVDKAINLLKAHQDKFTTSLVYLSDHGESLGENGVYLHGLPYTFAPETQKHVPMLIWLSSDYKQRFGVDEACLKKRAVENDYSQDNLFSTMLGLSSVRTKLYQANDDILSPCKSSQ